jgi:hypothetical protein
VDGNHHTPEFADRPAETLAVIGQDCARLSDQNPLHGEDAWRSNRGARTGDPDHQFFALATRRRYRII